MQSDVLIELITKVLVPLIIPTTITINNVRVIKQNNYRLEKLSKYNGEIIAGSDLILSKINSISNEEIDIRKKEILLPYIQKLANYVKEEDLKIVYNNLRNLNIKYDPTLVASGCTGKYIIEENKLLYSSKSSIGHEFLHMASSMYDSDSKLKLCGFYQEKNGASIGEGVTEGYTELLASRLYNKNGKVEAYKSSVKFCEILEFFFDDPKDMAHLYFNCNLPGLIKHLEKYASRQEIIKLIMDIDNICTYETAFANPYPLVKSIDIQLKLYNWFSSNSNDFIKIDKLRKKICENKAISIMLNNNINVCRDNIHASTKNNSDNIRKKR